MKKIAIICFTIFISTVPYAQRIPAESVDYPWHLLEQGKVAYEGREFGKALLLFRQAREMRKTQVAAQYDYLFSALKAPQVRAAGDLRMYTGCWKTGRIMRHVQSWIGFSLHILLPILINRFLHCLHGLI